MKRLCTMALVLMSWVLCPRPARAFRLIDPNTWPSALNPHNWPFTLIPIPEIATDPNSGVTYGVLAATLFTNDKNEITNIFAPDIISNSTLGPGGTFRFLSYRSEERRVGKECRSRWSP